MQKYEKIRIGGALFLDRDGVINRRLEGDFVHTPSQLELLPHAADAIARLSAHYEHIIVVTNQQSIDQGLMTDSQLQVIHDHMTDLITQAGGRIDRIYYCPAPASSHDFHRKPNIGMALDARRDFPTLRLNRSVMIGDAITDMLFGRRCGMQTILVGEWPQLAQQHPTLIDYAFPSLSDVADAIDRQYPTSR